MKIFTYLTILLLFFVTACSLPPNRSNNRIYDTYLEVKGCVLQEEEDYVLLEMLRQKRDQAISLQLERQKLLSEIETLEQQIETEAQNQQNPTQVATTIKAKPVPAPESQPEELKPILGQSCPWVVVDDQHMGELGSQIIRETFSLDYERLATDMGQSGQTMLLFEDGKEIFVTYQRESVRESVICREYEVVATIEGQPMIDMETVCRDGNQPWQLL